MNTQNKKGFTLVEIMIVVAIIGLLAAIGIPSFAKARGNSIKKAMENNARLVISGAEQYAIEAAIATNGTVGVANITPYLKNGLDGLAVGGNTVEETDFSTLTTLDLYDTVTNIASVIYGGTYDSL